MARDVPVGDEREHAFALADAFRAAADAMARATEDPAHCGRVRESGPWLEAALRAYGLESNAQWWSAVTTRGKAEPRAPYAWGALAAPRLEALATALEDEGTLAPLDAAEAGAHAHVRAIETCEEPTDPKQWLFCERAGERWAIAWDAVLEYGLAPGGDHTLVVVTDGQTRATFVADWLHGKGSGRRHGLGEVADQDGLVHRVLEPADLLQVQPAAPAADIELEEPPPPQGDPKPGQVAPADGPRAGASVSRALVADDSIVARVFLGRLLRQRGIEVDEAEDAESARALWAERTYDRVFLDADMPDGGAFTIAEAGRPGVVVLVKDELERKRAHALGFDVVLLKPFAEDEVARAVDAGTTRASPGG